MLAEHTRESIPIELAIQSDPSFSRVSKILTLGRKRWKIAVRIAQSFFIHRSYPHSSLITLITTYLKEGGSVQ